MKRVLRYLKGPPLRAIHFRPVPLKLIGYSDASHGDDCKLRRSSAGMVFMLANAPIYWQAKLQPLMTLSTFEAEYVAMSNATRNVLNVIYLLQELGQPPKRPVLICGDNRKAVDYVNDPEMTSRRTRHIDIHYHFTRQKVQDGDLKVDWVPTDLMAADGFTKPLQGELFRRFVALIRLQDA